MNRADRRKTAKTNKERIDEYNEAGRQMMTGMTDVKQAQRLFRQVLALDPGDAEANLNLGVLEMWTRNYPKAQEHFARAYERNPRSAQIMNNLGLSLHEQGGIAEAMPLYQQAIQNEPTNVEAHINLARAYLHTNQRAEALATAKRAVELNPDFGTAQFILGCVHQTMGNVVEARTALGKAINLVPGHTEANFRLARLSYDPENPESYLEPGRAAFEANADVIDAAIAFSEILFGAGKFDEAEKVLKPFETHENPGQRLGIMNGLAYANASRGNFEEAIGYHKKAIAITMDDPNCRYFFGRTLLWSGDYKAAAEQFQKAIRGLAFHQDLIGMLMLTQKLDGKAEAMAMEAANLIKEVKLEPKHAYPTIEDLNAAVLTKLNEEPKNPVHPFDRKRRLGDTYWEAALGKSHLEPILALGELFQEIMTGYVADMPDNVQNHPMLVRKQYGLGPSGSHAESASKFGAFSYALDQQGWFKIVYFLSVPEEVEDETKKAGWLRTGVPHFKNDFNIQPDKEIKPEAGKAVIMPAYHWHGFNALDAKEPLTFLTIQVNASVG